MPNNSQLKTFIQKARSQGKSEEEITRTLVEAGWQKDTILRELSPLTSNGKQKAFNFKPLLVIGGVYLLIVVGIIGLILFYKPIRTSPSPDIPLVTNVNRGNSKLGRSIATAIQVDSVEEEYEWLSQQVCDCGGGYDKPQQALVQEKNKYYDILTAKCTNCSDTQEFYFDISSFFSGQTENLESNTQLVDFSEKGFSIKVPKLWTVLNNETDYTFVERDNQSMLINIVVQNKNCFNLDNYLAQTKTYVDQYSDVEPELTEIKQGDFYGIESYRTIVNYKRDNRDITLFNIVFIGTNNNYRVRVIIETPDQNEIILAGEIIDSIRINDKNIAEVNEDCDSAN